MALAGLTPARPGSVWAVVDNQSRRKGERDEETPPGELTPRRIKALTPEQFAKFWRDESDKWAKVIKEANIRAE